MFDFGAVARDLHWLVFIQWVAQMRHRAEWQVKDGLPLDFEHGTPRSSLAIKAVHSCPSTSCSPASPILLAMRA